MSTVDLNPLGLRAPLSVRSLHPSHQHDYRLCSASTVQRNASLSTADCGFRYADSRMTSGIRVIISVPNHERYDRGLAVTPKTLPGATSTHSVLSPASCMRVQLHPTCQCMDAQYGVIALVDRVSDCADARTHACTRQTFPGTDAPRQGM
ncbi:hypothetical protein F1559_005165 [Cyanidiococcus yangmingshanensis]|uniref:Uncharacterized protein n=1 Tax=Cyanidiococcus yangmingshanensis TaxID=2690220 RepID=A0A7J7IFJ5_9RHOD|nr:hypothetical protein F1559_005165 [Cyanidiococcus yangmingshanensis]